MAWKIFKHAISMLLRNWQDVLRIIALPMAIGVILMVALVGSIVTIDQLATVEDPSQIAVIPILLFALVAVFLGIWCAVNWHRFVLLEDYQSGWIPALRVDRVLSYFGHGLLIGLVVVGCMIPVGMVVGLGMAANAGVAVLFMFGALVLLLIVFYRISLVLPAAAIGSPLGLKGAWAATRGQSWTIIGLAMLSGVLSFALNLTVEMLALALPLGGGVLSVAAQIFVSMLNLSIMTTLYGVFVQRRSLD